MNNWPFSERLAFNCIKVTPAVKRAFVSGSIKNFFFFKHGGMVCLFFQWVTLPRTSYIYDVPRIFLNNNASLIIIVLLTLKNLPQKRRTGVLWYIQGASHSNIKSRSRKAVAVSAGMRHQPPQLARVASHHQKIESRDRRNGMPHFAASSVAQSPAFVFPLVKGIANSRQPNIDIE